MYIRQLGILFLSLLLYTQTTSAQTLLNADGPGDTYELITSILAPNGNPIEVPDCNHEEFGRHIDEVYDSILEKYVFRFFMHVTPDNDRCINFDRQRNEIKTYAHSDDSLLGVLNETVIYSWKFKIDTHFQSSRSFTHLHQLKAVGGSYDGMPLITFTARKGNPDQLELRYAKESSQSTLKKVDLTPYKGEWVDVIEQVNYNDAGSYSVIMTRISDQKVLFSYNETEFGTWKEGASFIRPKWGIYRSLNNADDLRDEEVYFSDIRIEEIADTQSPVVRITTKATEPVSEAFNITITFNEEITGFTEDDLTVVNGIVQSGSLTSSNNLVFTATILPIATGNVTINLAADIAKDLAGNENQAADEIIVAADIPVISSSIIENKEGSFQLFPNPTSGQLFIVAGESLQFIGLTIFDSSGKTIYSDTHANTSIILDISSYNSGMYVVSIKTSEQVSYHKIILK